MRKISFILSLLLSAQIFISGCASIQKKFTRKKKAKPQVIQFYSEKEYKKEPADILYKKHLHYFNSWMGELLNHESFNYKSDIRNLTEAAAHLNDMKQYLVPEKKVLLDKYIAGLLELADKLKDGNVIIKENPRILAQLRSIKNGVAKNYSFSKIKTFIIKN